MKSITPIATVPTIVIHGGAGTILRSAMNTEQEQAYHDAMKMVLSAAQKILADDGGALDAVTLAVSLLEDCPLFNAGKGAVFTHAGTHELDASIMNGATLAAGAVANVTHVRNPILAARAVMEHSEHILLVGTGAEDFVAGQGVAMVDPAYFHTDARHTQWLQAREQGGMLSLDHDASIQSAGKLTVEIAPIDPNDKFGTVGAVALDCHGNLAAATSTGGMTNKRVGRVGDSPLIGAGCYANNRTAAVSATGTGEGFMRTVAAYDISARMDYAGLSLEDAARQVVMDLLPRYQGRGGLIAIDALGNLTMPFNTEGMYRGFAKVGDVPVTAIYR